MSQQNTLLKAAGIHSFKNTLSEIPPGALEKAVNVNIDRDGVIEPRRGISQYSDPFANSTKQLIEYKRRLIVHHGTTLSFEDDQGLGVPGLDGTFSDFSGSFTEASSGRRIRAIEANGNLYFTTSEGIKKISALTKDDFSTSSNFITQAGGIKALNLEATPDYSMPGFLQSNYKVAYRIVWGIRDANDNLILGTPSARAVVDNRDPINNCVVSLEFSVPNTVTSESYFYQIYRSAIVPNTNDPSDELQLVIEDFVETAEITAKKVIVQDITPEDFRANGSYLYTNPISGQGIEQANEPPPFAKDIELYKGYTFFANTSTKQSLSFSLLGIPGIVSGDALYISDGTTTRTYTFRGEVETYTVDFTGMAFPGAKAALDGTYFVIASANDELLYKVWFDNTGTTIEPTLAGTTPIKVDIQATPDTANDIAQKVIDEILLATPDFNGTNTSGVLTITTANNGNVDTDVESGTYAPTSASGFSIVQDDLGDGENSSINDFLLARVPTGSENGPFTSQQIDQTARSLVKIINSDSLGIVDAFYVSGTNDTPGQLLLEQKSLVGAQFRIYANSSIVAEKFNPTLGVLSVNETKVLSSNEIRPNRIYYSKFQEPEAVPILNYTDIGPRDEEIERIMALRDSLFVFKTDGIYRLSGDIAPFSIAPFDFSLTLTAPDTAVVLNNQIHAFTTQGVAQVTDTGVNIISRAIEDQLLEITRQQYNTATASFGVSYETDRSYLLFTVTEATDTYATRCFRYNSFTNTWTTWEMDRTCGIVNIRDDKLYLGAVDINIIEKERKGLDRNDFADREFEKSIVPSGVSSNIITLSSLSNVEVGDAILQIQYLTISQYNRLIKRISLDSFLNEDFTDLLINPGDNLRTAVDDLADRLTTNANTTTDYTLLVTSSLDFSTIQSEYNAIITALNADSGAFFSDYDQSIGTVDQEAVIISISEDSSNKVTNNFSYPFVEGAITHFKAIESEVIYAPQTLGDPTFFKQVSEGTFIFENKNFTIVTTGYKTDLSPSLETTTFSGAGIGDWGQFIWGEQNWGGVSSAAPLRTFVPLQKQRCRFIQPQVKHKVAFEKWSLFGISVWFRPYSQRAYR